MGKPKVDGLKVDQELMKEYDVISDLTPEQKVAHLSAQIDQIKSVIFTKRIDIIVSRNLQQSEDINLANKGSENERNFRFELQQFAMTLRIFTKMRDELDTATE